MYTHVPTSTGYVPITLGTMMDRGSLRTGMYLAIGRLYTGIADCERWGVDRPHMVSGRLTSPPPMWGGGGHEVLWASCIESCGPLVPG